MTDIVERLRDWETIYPEDDRLEVGGLYRVAADEIEKLRKTRDELLRSLADRDYEIARLLGRIDT